MVSEPESSALLASILSWPERTSATLLRAEATRALRRSGQDSAIGAARQLFGAMRLVHIDEPLLDRAGELSPLALRSLDAIHLAAALAIGPDLAVLLTYDRRLAEAARGAGLLVDSPS